MLLNILYYDQAAAVKQTKEAASLTFGPLYITPEQVCTDELKRMEKEKIVYL